MAMSSLLNLESPVIGMLKLTDIKLLLVINLYQTDPSNSEWIRIKSLSVSLVNFLLISKYSLMGIKYIHAKMEYIFVLLEEAQLFEG